MRGIGVFVGIVLVTAGAASCSGSEPEGQTAPLEAPSHLAVADEEFELTSPDAMFVADPSNEPGSTTNTPADQRQVVTTESPARRRSHIKHTREQNVIAPPAPVQTISRSSCLDFKVAYDAGMPAWAFEAVLTMPGAPARRHRAPQGGRPVRIDKLPTGLATLVIRLTDSHFELARIEGIAIPASGVAPDTRLMEIDLRGRVKWMRGCVRNALDEPFASRTLSVTDGANHSVDAHTDAGGCFAVPVPSSVHRLTANARGYQSQPFENGGVIRLARKLGF